MERMPEPQPTSATDDEVVGARGVGVVGRGPGLPGGLDHEALAEAQGVVELLPRLPPVFIVHHPVGGEKGLWGEVHRDAGEALVQSGQEGGGLCLGGRVD
jgi:hypothetical protein